MPGSSACIRALMFPAVETSLDSPENSLVTLQVSKKCTGFMGHLLTHSLGSLVLEFFGKSLKSLDMRSWRNWQTR